MQKLVSRLTGKYHRTLAERLHRRVIPLGQCSPIISFTFDDAPRTAFKTAGEMLESRGLRATFFVSLGLLGTETEVGAIASQDDLCSAVAGGHELGCHTFDHLDGWHTPTDIFMASVARNSQALESLFPGLTLPVFAYPKSGARSALKRRLGDRFLCARGGGQRANVGVADLNLLNACFLDKRTGIELQFVKQLIDHAVSTSGWLILATHDVTDNPSPYGCTPQLFENIVQHAMNSGAEVLPVGKACEQLLSSATGAPAPA